MDSFRLFFSQSLTSWAASMATTISTAESTVGTATTDSCGLSGLGCGIGLVGRLLGSGEIGQ
jgi:hypothetical protein